MKNILSEDDVKRIFGEAEPQNTPVEVPDQAETTNKKSETTLEVILKFFIIFIVSFFFSYAVINFSAFGKKIGYFWTTSIVRSPQPSATPVAIATPLDPTSSAQLEIPKINVDAPITWNVDEAGLKQKLLEGVVHSKGTGLPGEPGNVFITGHSSYYSWVSSPYKDIFALLDKLSVGDKIFIKYQSAALGYTVSNIQVVSPSNVSVMDSTDGRVLSLMTCVPVGTNINRLIVTATQDASGSSSQ